MYFNVLILHNQPCHNVSGGVLPIISLWANNGKENPMLGVFSSQKFCYTRLILCILKFFKVSHVKFFAPCRTT
ncbi:Uncharacterised protein [Moraxella ovis]|nr:Uncharacterised protein [Moraxella ovis]